MGPCEREQEKIAKDRGWLQSILTHQSGVYLALCLHRVFSFKNYLLFYNTFYLLTAPKYGLWLNKHAVRLRKIGVTPLTTTQPFTGFGDDINAGGCWLAQMQRRCRDGNQSSFFFNPHPRTYCKRERNMDVK